MAFNKMLVQFEQVIEQVATSTRAVSRSAQEVSDIAKQSAKQTADQKSDIHSMGSAMSEMVATIKEVSDRTTEAAKIAQGGEVEVA